MLALFIEPTPNKMACAARHYPLASVVNKKKLIYSSVLIRKEAFFVRSGHVGFGDRDDNSNLYRIGDGALLWSRSSSSQTGFADVYHLFIDAVDSNNVIPASIAYRFSGMSLRCLYAS